MSHTPPSSSILSAIISSHTRTTPTSPTPPIISISPSPGFSYVYQASNACAGSFDLEGLLAHNPSHHTPTSLSREFSSSHSWMAGDVKDPLRAKLELYLEDAKELVVSVVPRKEQKQFLTTWMGLTEEIMSTGGSIGSVVSASDQPPPLRHQYHISNRRRKSRCLNTVPIPKIRVSDPSTGKVLFLVKSMMGGTPDDFVLSIVDELERSVGDQDPGNLIPNPSPSPIVGPLHGAVVLYSSLNRFKTHKGRAYATQMKLCSPTGEVLATLYQPQCFCLGRFVCCFLCLSCQHGKQCPTVIQNQMGQRLMTAVQYNGGNLNCCCKVSTTYFGQNTFFSGKKMAVVKPPDFINKSLNIKFYERSTLEEKLVILGVTIAEADLTFPLA